MPKKVILSHLNSLGLGSTSHPLLEQRANFTCFFFSLSLKLAAFTRHANWGRWGIVRCEFFQTYMLLQTSQPFTDAKQQDWPHFPWNSLVDIVSTMTTMVIKRIAVQKGISIAQRPVGGRDQKCQGQIWKLGEGKWKKNKNLLWQKRFSLGFLSLN